MVRLLDLAGNTIDAVAYDSQFRWAQAADALGCSDRFTGLSSTNYQYKGRSLQRVSVTWPSSDPANWLASPLTGPITFSAQTTDVSLGRRPAGASTIVSFSSKSASPGYVNWAPTNVVINELLANPAAPLEAAIELHNTNSSAVDIGGWGLRDDLVNRQKFHIPAGTTIPAGGYKTFYGADFAGGIRARRQPRAGGGSLAKMNITRRVELVGSVLVADQNAGARHDFPDAA